MIQHFFAWKKMADSHTIQTLVLSDILSQMNEVSLSLQIKQRTMFIVNNKIWAFNENQNFGEFVYTTMSLTASQNIKTTDKIGDINKCDFFSFLYDELHHYLENLHNLVNQMNNA